MADLIDVGDAAAATRPDASEERVRSIGPIDITVVSLQQAVRLIVEDVQNEGGHVFSFCNAHTVNTALKIPEFANAMGNMTVFNDGIGVDIASRLLYGAPFTVNLCGTDLIPAVFAHLSREIRVFLVGSSPGVAEAAARKIERRYRFVRIVGIHHGFFDLQQEEDIIRNIVNSNANLLLVGMGHPHQELFAQRNVGKLSTTIVCVGAFLDFSAGKVRRAPRVLRTARMEWVFRFLLEPRRLAKRYLFGNISFLLYILRRRILG